jgi:hypothetical protein
MSVVIIGGNERMECLYKDLCRSYGFSAKVFTKSKGEMQQKIGTPDLLILFTGTVSHRMTGCALNVAKRSKIPVERSHSSSISALKNILSYYCKEEYKNDQNI